MRARRLGAITAAIAVLVAIAGCTVTSKPSSAPTTRIQSTAPGVEKIGGEHRFPGDITVSVTRLAEFKLTDYQQGAQPGDVGVQVEVRISNMSDNPFEAKEAQVALSSGPKQIDELRVRDAEAGDGFSASIAPGRFATALFGFGVPPANLGHLTVSVRPGFDYGDGIFEGRLAVS